MNFDRYTCKNGKMQYLIKMEMLKRLQQNQKLKGNRKGVAA